MKTRTFLYADGTKRQHEVYDELPPRWFISEAAFAGFSAGVLPEPVVTTREFRLVHVGVHGGEYYDEVRR